MYERKAFSNKIDTRERSVKFLERAGMIELGEKFEERMVDLVEDYLYQLFERHKILPENANAKRELIANFKTTMELFLQRHENLVSEVHKFSEDKRKTKTKFYDVVNARDAFAHIVAFPMEGIVEDVLEATRVVEKRILKK